MYICNLVLDYAFISIEKTFRAAERNFTLLLRTSIYVIMDIVVMCAYPCNTIG